MKRLPHVLKRIFQVLVFGLLAVVGGCTFLIEIPLVLTFGWGHFLRTIAPHVTVNPAMAVVGLTILPILGIGTHRFLVWFSAHDTTSAVDPSPCQPWRWTWSLSALAIFLLMFITSIATTGILHQTLWLFTDSDSPLQDAFYAPTWRTKRHIESAGKELSFCLEKNVELPKHLEPISFQNVDIPESCRRNGLSAIDSWGTPLLYASNGHSYVLTSYGRNKVPGGGDGKFDDYIFADGKFIVPTAE